MFLKMGAVSCCETYTVKKHKHLLGFGSQFRNMSNDLKLGQLSQYSNSLWVGRSRDRIPVGARFFAPVQIGSEATLASYTKGTGSFLGVKWLGRGIDHPPPSSAEVTERVELHIYSPSGPSWPFQG